MSQRIVGTFPRRVGCDSVMAGQLAEAADLGLDPSEVGCSCQKVSGDDTESDFWDTTGDEEDLFLIEGFNPFKSIGRLTKKVTRAVKSVPVLGAPFKAADSVLHSTVVRKLQHTLANPWISTAFGPVAITGNLLLSTAKEGPEGALRVAKDELKNPVRQAAIKAVAVVFPPAAPAAAMYEAANRVVQAVDHKDPAEAVKAVAQIAATQALAETGDADAIKGLDMLKKAKAAYDKLPKLPSTPTLIPRTEVCGAKSEEGRGVWLKTHTYMDGPYMCMTIYSVANADTEVVNLKVDMRPIIKQVAQYHKMLHAAQGKPAHVGGLFDSLQKVATNLGRAKLAQQAFTATQTIAAKARCQVQTPKVPVSDLALTAYAAARKGVDAVDMNAKLKQGMEEAATHVSNYIDLKNRMKKLAPPAKAAMLKDPSVRQTILKGIGAKFSIANFVKQGGTERAKAIRANATQAAKQFAHLSASLQSPDPKVRSDAQTMAKVVSIAAKTRAKTQQTVQKHQAGQAGLVFDSKGRKLHRGLRFHKSTPKKGQATQVFVPEKGPIQTGVFQKVAGASHSAYTNRLRNRLKKIHQLAIISGVSVPELIGMMPEFVGMEPVHVGRSSHPHYSKALRRRLMACRADCETNLVGEAVEEGLVGRCPLA